VSSLRKQFQSYNVNPLWLYTGAVALWVLASLGWGQSLTFDNGSRVYIVTGALEPLFRNVYHLELAPPGWHLIAWLLTHVSPIDPVMTLRGFNGVLYVALLPLAYFGGRELGDKRTGLIAAGIAPLHPVLLYRATRVDHYMLFLTVTLAYVALAPRLFNKTDRSDSVAVVVALAFLGATHYYGLVIAALGFGIGTVVLCLEDWRNWKRMVRWGFVHLAAFVGVIGFYPYSIRHLRSTGAGVTTGGFTLSDVLQQTIPLETQIPTILVGLWLLAAIGLGFYESGVARYVFIIGVFFGYITLGVLRPTYSTRHMTPLIVMVPLIVAPGIQLGVRHLTIGFDTKRVAQVLMVLLVLCAPFVPVAATATPPNDPTEFDEYANVVAAHDGDDTIIYSLPSLSEGTLRVYYDTDSPIIGVSPDATRRDVFTGSGRIKPRRSGWSGSHQEISINDYETVIVWFGHGYKDSRWRALRSELNASDYHEVEKQTKWWNGVAVYEKNESGVLLGSKPLVLAKPRLSASATSQTTQNVAKALTYNSATVRRS